MQGFRRCSQSTPKAGDVSALRKAPACSSSVLSCAETSKAWLVCLERLGFGPGAATAVSGMDAYYQLRLRGLIDATKEQTNVYPETQLRAGKACKGILGATVRDEC